MVRDCNLLDAADNGGQATARVQAGSSWQNMLISSRWDRTSGVSIWCRGSSLGKTMARPVLSDMVRNLMTQADRASGETSDLQAGGEDHERLCCRAVGTGSAAGGPKRDSL